MNKRNIVFVVFFVGSFLFYGCSTVSYYSQSVAGHTAIMWSQKPISEVIEAAEEPLKKRLQTAVSIRKFSVDELALPDNKSYSSYVHLKRDAVVWNVVAADVFSLKAKQWCYLVIGCASYRGYFNKERAEEYASNLRQQGLDVAVIGATAYSTLGWFSDPLTSLMLKRDDASVAELIFHELAHQQLYVKGDSRFNEAFASAVGEEGALIWLRATHQEDLLRMYQRRLQVRDDFVLLINTIKKELQTVYQSELSREQKLQKKQDLFEQLQQSYQQLKIQKWQGKGWYDRWFSEPVNNARLVAIGTYRDQVPEFTELLMRCDYNFSRFYQAVEQVANSEDRSDFNKVVRCQ